MRITTKQAAEELGISTSLLLSQAESWGITLIPKNPNAKRKTYVIEQDDVEAYKRKQSNQSAPVRRFEI